MMLIMQMEKIIRNPGLQHLAEEVFWNLNVEDLKVCAQINQSILQTNFAKSGGSEQVKPVKPGLYRKSELLLRPSEKVSVSLP